MSQHTHTWLHPPYWSPQSQPKPKHKLAGGKQIVIVLAAVLMPFLIPILLSVLQSHVLVYLAIAFVLTISLPPFPKAFVNALALAILPYAIFYGVSALNPFSAELKDGLRTVFPYSVSLVFVLTAYYSVILNLWETQTNKEPKHYWFSIIIASVLLVCLYGFGALALQAHNPLGIFVILVLALFAPFFPPIVWVSMLTHHTPHLLPAVIPVQNIPKTTDTTKSNDLAPYSPTEFYLVGFFLSVIGTTILAIVNARRMGELKRVWLIVLIALLIVIGGVLLSIAFNLLIWFWFIASVVFVIGVVEWQKPAYYRWLEAHGGQKPSWAERGGWLQFGIVLGGAILGYYAIAALTQIIFANASRYMPVYLSVVGCIITMLGPVAYDLFVHSNQLQPKQMWIYTIGWLLSLLYANVWILGGVMAAGGGGMGNIRDIQITSLVWSSLAYVPIVFAAILISWILFRFRHHRLARLVMVLPLVNVIIYVTTYLSLLA